MKWPCVMLMPLLCAASSGAQEPPQHSTADLHFFEKKIRPLLSAHCFKCHSTKAKRVRGGLLLDSRAAVIKGGDGGQIFVSKKPETSRLVKAVQYRDADLQMPPKGKLSKRDIALFEEWIRRGAPFPESGKSVVVDSQSIDIAKGRKFWSFRPLQKSAPPAVRNRKWPSRRIDAYILAKLEKHGLSPSAPATRQVLIRRASFDLVGLPPTPQQVEAFVNDESPDAYQKLVERLLASPHYGERWARYWLDLTRYCDVAEAWHPSQGQAYLYRDWVVRSFNDDLPYDEFVVSQLAADLLPGQKPAERAALGFLGCSPKYWKELKLDHTVIKAIVAEEWEERIEAISRTFLGLTVACARCHDHKFDPITTEDYYALAGVLASTKLVDRALLPDASAVLVQKARETVYQLQKELAKLKRSKSADAKRQAEKLKIKIGEIKKSTPHFDMPLALAVEDAALFVMPDGAHQTKLVYKTKVARDLRLQKRGSPINLGPKTARRFLEVLSTTKPKPFQNGSGRLELAKAIVNEAAPLTARVIVNRIWKHHFGKGLVETPSNFGFQGERPSHPELLDDLAARFIENGWAMKWLHREIMLSSAYRQTSNPKSKIQNPKSIDPGNRLLSRMNRRRLDVEAWRDAMLAVTGTLDRKIGGPPLKLNDPSNNRRTIYGVVKRRELSDILRLHDFPDPTNHSPNRVPTTTPLQQLFTLNSPFMRQQATALARRLKRECPENTETRVRFAYRLLFGRLPTRKEMNIASAFLNSGNESGSVPDALWEQYAHALLGSNEFLFLD